MKASGLFGFMALGSILKEIDLPATTSSTSTSTSRTVSHGTIFHGTPTTREKPLAAVHSGLSEKISNSTGVENSLLLP